MDEWVKCTFHRKCICGGDLGTGDNCKLNETHSIDHTLYADCHRYDQAILTLLCAKQFGVKNADKVITSKPCSKVFNVIRHASSDWVNYIVKKDTLKI
jgi:hypothetical protein